MIKKSDRNSYKFTQPYQDHSLGSTQARIKLIEYGDYQCPQCAAAHQVVQALLAEFGEQVQFVFRHFPLTDVHQYAQNAAEAAEAAGSQGKFWEMHNCLFMNSPTLDDGSIVECAISLRLNINQFLKEITGNIHADRIAAHVAQGKKLGVDCVPIFVINQQRFDGDWSQSELIQAVSKHLQQDQESNKQERGK